MDVPAEPALGDVLARCQVHMANELGQAMARTMAQIDDALFDLADHATDNKEQALYFDAMREVRLKRSAMESGFKDDFITGGNDDIKAVREPPATFGDPDTSTMELSIVDSDALEQSLAVANMITKVTDTCREQLAALNIRVGKLLGDQDLKRYRNPLGPERVCATFERACEHVDLDVKIKLLILKLFDRYVASEMDAIYRSANHFLAQAGVIPEIPVTALHRGSHRHSPRRRADSAFHTAPTDGEYSQQFAGGPVSSHEAPLLNALEALLQGHYAAGGSAVLSETFLPSGRGGATNQSIGDPSSPNLPPTADDRQYLGHLTRLQHGDISGLQGSPLVFDTQVLAQGTSNVLRPLKATFDAAGVAGVDGVLIDIVAMLFDFILDNDQLPQAISAQIGRLQIPVLKAAILDRNLFASKQHPVRQLLNRLAEVGLSCDSGDTDPVFQQIQRQVNRIVNEFDVDLEIFSSALHALDDAVRAEQEMAEREERRATKLAERKSRLAAAKIAAEQLVEQHTLQDDVPAFVEAFLRRYWHQLLVLVHYRHGNQSDAWRYCVETLQVVMWSTCSTRTLSDRKRIVENLPRLVRRLKKGMAHINIAPEARNEFLSALEQRHTDIIRKTDAGTAVPNRDPDRSLPPSHPSEESTSAAEPSHPTGETAQNTPQSDPPAPAGEIVRQASQIEASQPESLSATATPEPIETAVPESTATEPESDEDEAQTEEAATDSQLLRNLFRKRGIDVTEFEIEEITLGTAALPEEELIEDEFTATARSMKRGTWIESVQSDTHPLRSKLSWINPSTGVYLFTNRRGVKEIELTLAQVSGRLRRGEMRVLTDTPLIDQAVAEMLHSMHKDQVQPTC